MQIKHYFLPSETNDYKPWVITPTALVVFCLVIWSLKILLPVGLTLAQSSIDSADLMSRVNAERSQRFIPVLTANSKLSSAATGKSNDMLSRSYFGHVDPEGNYVWPRIEAAGYAPYSALGENLAMDFSAAGDVVNAWMNSPTHRANIVNEKFEDQGMAAIWGSFEPNHNTVMITNLFGTLLKTSPPPPAPSPSPTPPPSPAPAPRPSPSPAPTEPPPAPPAPQAVTISDDIKISTISISGQIKVNVDAIITGSPTLVIAQLKSQSISLLPGKSTGQFQGGFTFDSTENLSGHSLFVEARDKSNNKISKSFPVNFQSEGVSGNQNLIPVSNEAQIIRILRIVFGIFASIYVGFLAVDAYLIHRAKIKRAGVHPGTHILLFILIATVSLFI